MLAKMSFPGLFFLMNVVTLADSCEIYSILFIFSIMFFLISVVMQCAVNKIFKLELFFYFPVGTFRIKGYEVIHSVLDTALQAGYRLIGT